MLSRSIRALGTYKDLTLAVVGGQVLVYHRAARVASLASDGHGDVLLIYVLASICLAVTSDGSLLMWDLDGVTREAKRARARASLGAAAKRLKRAPSVSDDDEASASSSASASASSSSSSSSSSSASEMQYDDAGHLLLNPLAAISLPRDFEVTAMEHPNTYLNKMVLGSSTGELQLWNIKTHKLIHAFEVCPRFPLPLPLPARPSMMERQVMMILRTA